MQRLVFLSIFFLAAVAGVGAQGFKPPVTGVGIVYNRETVFNLKVSTNHGFAPGLEFGTLRTYYKTTYYHVSLGELKHPKEQRQSAGPSATRSFRPYVFGKQNNLFAVRAGWGVKRYYSEKARQKGVALGMSYSFGPTLGLLKPYYLVLGRVGELPGSTRVVHERYSGDNAEIFLDNTHILGASAFSKGVGQLSILPGANASIAYHMDWGAFDEFVKALEIGLMVDVFTKRVPILVTEENRQVFFNFFLNLQFGKRR